MKVINKVTKRVTEVKDKKDYDKLLKVKGVIKGKKETIFEPYTEEKVDCKGCVGHLATIAKLEKALALANTPQVDKPGTQETK